MGEKILIEAGRLDVKAYKNADFGLTLSEFDFELSEYNFYAQLKDKRNTVIATFEIEQGSDNLVILMRRAVLNDIPDGIYYYDLKRVSDDATAWENIIMQGKFEVVSGVTILP